MMKPKKKGKKQITSVGKKVFAPFWKVLVGGGKSLGGGGKLINAEKRIL